MAKQAKVLVVFNEKGGAGKTTTACQLAGTLGARGYDVLVADMDPQQTAAAWLAMGDDKSFPATIWPGFRYGPNVIHEVQKLVDKYDVIVADCAPSVEQQSTWAILLVADAALIPTRLSPPDIVALASAKRLVRKAFEQSSRSYPVRVVANAARMHIGEDREYLRQLQDDEEFPPLATTMGDRKAFSRAMLLGATAHAVRGGEEAVREIEAVTDEVVNLIGLPKRKKAR